MRVCIILSTYNGKKYVCQQLDSIFQSAEDMDIFLYVRMTGQRMIPYRFWKNMERKTMLKLK